MPTEVIEVPAVIAEYREQSARLDEAGVKTKGGESWYSRSPDGEQGGYIIYAVYTDSDDVGDMMSLSSVDEVTAFLGSWCPECWRVDRRRTKGGVCNRRDLHWYNDPRIAQ